MSGEWIEIGEPGDLIPAWRVSPREARRGGVVVIQEIFGVNPHIRDVCESFAELGYEVLAPAMFHRHAPGFEAVDIDAAAIERGRALAAADPIEVAVADCQSAINWLRPSGPVFFTGFCYGGSLSWLVAQRCEGVSAVSSFYGRLAPDYLDAPLRVPLIAHFGRNDESIPMARVEALMAAYPDVPVHVYNAGHGFMRQGAHYHADSAKLAWLRTLQLFQRNSGVKAEV